MAKALNFNNVSKKYWNVTLTDGTVLLVGTPTKAIFDKLIAIKDDLGDEDSLGALYGVCALVLSRNKAGKVITKEYLEEIFDIEDIIILFNSYVGFVNEIRNSKN
jgi:hypothetical protein